jgi:ATP-dependent Lhr-like helicase
MLDRAKREAGAGAVARWLSQRAMKPLPFQRAVWRHIAAGRSGLLHATTGAGKTLAVALGAWLALRGKREDVAQICVIWITPMRALAADTAWTLSAVFAEIATLDSETPPWSVDLRTGDTDSATRARQRRKPPALLVTTPESLTLMLARPDAREHLAALGLVVVDEWHELLGSKRGVQTELALARLRNWNSGLMTWGLSATLGNLEDAKGALLGTEAASRGALVSAKLPKRIVVDTLLPDGKRRFPWAGRMGLDMLPAVIGEIEAAATTLLFTNTRNQAEVWYRELLVARPNWAGILALHHGSLAQEQRLFVEEALKRGAMKAVVCTSSLDLGVDFLPVERVLQIGSPKGVARVLQRAGRSGHAPGRTSRLTLAPAHALELVEAAATRRAIALGRIEERERIERPLDVLAQHLVTIGLGGGFEPDALFAEIKTTAAYARLNAQEWRWCLDFVRQGGSTLGAYPQYRRVAPDEGGVWRVNDKRLAARHRLNIGTIVNDASISVQYGPAPPGRKLGFVEERFIGRVKRGERFWFAGKLLELVELRDLTAYVRKASVGKATPPRWDGGRMPLSTTLAESMLERLAEAANGLYEGPEMRAAEPMLELQRKQSALPTPEILLAEALDDREGSHLFLYPFAGRNAHIGIASHLAWRAAQSLPGAFSIAVNDYGFSLLSATRRDWASELPALLAVKAGALEEEIVQSLNAAELARRKFRAIAQIAGLVSAAEPGAQKGARQLQASSSLFYDVFRRFDPDNALLRQAEREALEQELEIRRLRRELLRMQTRRLSIKSLSRCSPLGFPLIVERLRERLSNESLTARVERMTLQLESYADNEPR